MEVSRVELAPGLVGADDYSWSSRRPAPEADPLDRFGVEASPRALVIALTCLDCEGVVTVARKSQGGETGPMLTLAQLVAVARRHVCENRDKR